MKLGEQVLELCAAECEVVGPNAAGDAVTHRQAQREVAIQDSVSVVRGQWRARHAFQGGHAQGERLEVGGDGGHVLAEHLGGGLRVLAGQPQLLQLGREGVGVHGVLGGRAQQPAQRRHRALDVGLAELGVRREGPGALLTSERVCYLILFWYC